MYFPPRFSRTLWPALMTGLCFGEPREPRERGESEANDKRYTQKKKIVGERDVRLASDLSQSHGLSCARVSSSLKSS